MLPWKLFQEINCSLGFTTTNPSKADFTQGEAANLNLGCLRANNKPVPTQLPYQQTVHLPMQGRQTRAGAQPRKPVSLAPLA